MCGKAHFCKENHYFNIQIFSESITVEMLNVITTNDFQIDFCHLTVYYQYHMAIFSSYQAQSPVMNWMYSQNLDLKFPSQYARFGIVV